MECHNHPDREAVANCSVCGKAVCPECSMEIAGNIYCKDCVNEIVTKSILEKAVQEKSANEELVEEPVEEIVEEPIDVIEPIEPITPIQAEEVEEEIVPAVEKAPENFETDFEYETEYVETYEEDGAEDSYYENPELIPEPEPEYKEHERKLKEEAIAKQAPIEPIHTEDIDEDYYFEEPIPAKAPSNELEAKYERYLEDLYYDEEEKVEDIVPQELLDEVEEEAPKARPPRGRQKRRQPRMENEEYYESPRRQRPRDYPPRDRGEYYINPIEEAFEDEYIVPSHNRGRRDAESYEELKRRIERNYEMEQEKKKRGRFRRSKKSKRGYDDDLENIQEMHRFPDEYEESEGKLSITEIILAVILILLIIALILYVVYLFRLSGDYVSFIDALTGLIQNPSEFVTNVLN